MKSAKTSAAILVVATACTAIEQPRYEQSYLVCPSLIVCEDDLCRETEDELFIFSSEGGNEESLFTEFQGQRFRMYFYHSTYAGNGPAPVAMGSHPMEYPKLFVSHEPQNETPETRIVYSETPVMSTVYSAICQRKTE